VFEAVRGLVMSGYYYAVAKGKKTGIFNSWSDCQKQVNGYPGAKFKKFGSKAEALEFVQSGASSARETFPMVALGSQQTKDKFQGWKKSEDNGKSFLDSLRTAGFTSTLPSQPPKVATTACNEIYSLMENTKATVLCAGTGVDNLSAGDSLDKDQLQTLINSGKATVIMVPQATANYMQLIDKAEGANGQTGKIGRQGRSPSGMRSARKGKKANDTTRTLIKAPCTTFDSKYISVYTDGACEENGRRGARAGIGVYWGPNHRFNVSEPLLGRQTNNRAEIHAAIRAIRQAKSEGLPGINVHTDSKFMIKSITEWIQKWKRNGWKLSTGSPVINREDFEELEEAKKGIIVRWVYVKGHAGHAGNEAADQLAKNGIST